jgi:hypothetical protein
MSLPDRKVLIDACLNSGILYYRSMFRFYKTFNGKLVKKQRCFFRQGGSTVMKCHLVKWDLIARPKEKRGLGIKDLEKMNTSLLIKLWWKLENKEELW